MPATQTTQEKKQQQLVDRPRRPRIPQGYYAEVKAAVAEVNKELGRKA